MEGGAAAQRLDKRKVRWIPYCFEISSAST